MFDFCSSFVVILKYRKHVHKPSHALTIIFDRVFMLHASSPFFGETLKLVTYCPLCETKHSSTEAKVLDENDGAKLVHIQCKKCSASVVAVVFQNALGMSTVGVVTDLTSTDVLKFREHENVNSDDVLNALDRLRKEKYDMAKIFGSLTAGY